MNESLELVILKEDMIGYSLGGRVATLLKGTVVNLEGFTSLFFYKDTVVHYNPDERHHLFEPLDPEEVIK